MEKRAEGERHSARQAKKIKTEHAKEKQNKRKSVSPAPKSSTPAPRKGTTPPPTEAPRAEAEATAASSTPAPAASTPAGNTSVSNLDRLANIAANTQRTDANTPLAYRMDSSLLQTPTGSGNLPLSLQRLQAMRNGQASPMASTPTSAGSNAPAFDHLVDVMGFSGVDLRAEEAFIQQGSLWEDASQTASAVLSNAGMGQGLYLNVYPLSAMVHRVAKRYGLKVDAATLDYLSIATRMRFRNMLEAMVRVSRHRAWSSYQRPAPLDADGNAMYHEAITSNPSKQLSAIEKAERIEEGNWRRMRLEREEAEAAAQEAAAAGEDPNTPGANAKRGKRPLGTSGRNLSEDVRKRLADSTAMRHLGANNVASKYAWLQSPGMRATPRAPRESDDQEANTSGGSLPKPKFAPQTPAPAARLAPTQPQAGVWSDVATRQAAQKEQERVAKARVTLRDALTALEREEAGGAGRGSGGRALYIARAWGRGRRN